MRPLQKRRGPLPIGCRAGAPSPPLTSPSTFAGESGGQGSSGAAGACWGLPPPCPHPRSRRGAREPRGSPAALEPLRGGAPAGLRGGLRRRARPEGPGLGLPGAAEGGPVRVACSRALGFHRPFRLPVFAGGLCGSLCMIRSRSELHSFTCRLVYVCVVHLCAWSCLFMLDYFNICLLLVGFRVAACFDYRCGCSFAWSSVCLCSCPLPTSCLLSVVCFSHVLFVQLIACQFEKLLLLVRPVVLLYRSDKVSDTVMFVCVRACFLAVSCRHSCHRGSSCLHWSVVFQDCTLCVYTCCCTSCCGR